MNKQKILVVEDDDSVQSALARYFTTFFADRAELVQCFTLADGEAAFANDPDSFMACIVDGNIPDKNSPGLRLVETIAAQKTHVKIVAFSSDPNICKSMVDAGAAYSVNGQKSNILAILKELLATVPVGKNPFATVD